MQTYLTIPQIFDYNEETLTYIHFPVMLIEVTMAGYKTHDIAYTSRTFL